MGLGQTAQVVLTVDVAVLRHTFAGIEILLIKRGKAPFPGQWALPGGKLDQQDRTLEDAATREMFEETGLVLSELVHIGVFGDMGRDPRGRYVSVLYASSVLPGTFPSAGDDAAAAAWFPLALLPSPLAFDHDQLVSAVIERL